LTAYEMASGKGIYIYDERRHLSPFGVFFNLVSPVRPRNCDYSKII
jgi:hypothetical protein